jgi:hypothetical protein
MKVFLSSVAESYPKSLESKLVLSQILPLDWRPRSTAVDIF